MTECPRCGSQLSESGQHHFCDPLDATIRYDLPTTEAGRRAVSEGVRKLYRIDPEFWWAGRDPPDPQPGSDVVVAPGAAKLQSVTSQLNDIPSAVPTAE